MNNIGYRIMRGIIYALSLLPFRMLYVLSDILYVLVYKIVGYRRKTVSKNLRNSFPDKTKAELLKIERDFYHSFCDNMVEMFKLLSISPEEIHRRMTFSGNDEIEKSLDTHQFCFIYLGHFCNWEWISSIPLWAQRTDHVNAQLYRPLKNKVIDELFIELRTHFGATNISKYEALRHILTYKKEGRRAIVGFISDQSPTPINIYEWVDFLHQDTPVFTGTERIAKKVDAAIYFADVERESRGHYRLRLRLMTEDARAYPDYQLTEQYMRELEQMILRQPHLWLWSHKRWKHTRAAVEEVQRAAKREQ